MSLVIIKIPSLNLTAKHLLKANCLSTKLHSICIVLLFLASLVLDRNHAPCSFFTLQRKAIFVFSKFNNIALSYQSQLERANIKASHDQSITASLTNRFIMRSLMDKVPQSSQQIFIPLLLDMDKSPLSLTK